MNVRAPGNRKFLLLFVVLPWLIMGNAVAQEQPAAGNGKDQAWTEASKAAIRGPQSVALLDQAQLELPEGYIFIPKAQGKALMEAMGNSVDERFVGLIFPRSEAQWFVTLDYEAAGYIKDDDAKDWNAKELLENLKSGTEAGNQRRQQMGVPPIMVTRWVESPAYDSTTHRLVWSAEAKLKNTEDPDPTINYNTYVLGREGYVSLDLITSSSHVDNDKRHAKELLSAVAFKDGKRYADFNSSTDKVAAYGLAALVGGLAIKKLGLLAVIGAFLLKFAKVIIVGSAALGGGIMKFFKRKPATGE